YHGFDPAVFQKNYSDIEINNTLKSYNLKPKAYILYVGGIQPRKNLAVLIRAFEKLKKSELSFDNLKLVLAGGKAWLAQETQNLALQSPCSEAIVMPGKLKFDDLGHLYRGAGVYVYPSLYDGFGITLLEAMVAKVPVISADNSSLPEVGGNACLYFKGEDAEDLARKIQLVLTDKNLREDLIAKGIEQIKNFSWEKCAKETLEFLKS
ncbi:MAG: glycosyltransferase family 1 protein, partial [Candidatus Moranbacteria bacterium]|nr:glycosyltransferase family 1 protein [Candidatus Moranbacteria bacterium]